MKKNISFLLILSVALAVSICISCKSTAPAPAPQPAPRPQVAQPAQTADEDKARADKARQRAMDFETPSYFPSEWEDAESQYNSASDAASYNAVAVVYDNLLQKALPLYAQAREDEIMAVREQLISSGFSNTFPQYLKKADDMALAAQAEYESEAGDYYRARDMAAEALSEYQTLLMGSKILTARKEIIDRGFTQYDPDNFQKADEVAQSALKAYEGGDRNGAVTNGEEALLRYNLVLGNGWIAYASDRKAAAEKERELALAERANVASRDTFRGAETFFNQAGELLAAENYKDAGLNYIEAEARYAISRKETEEKRIRAEEAIRIAEEKIEESSESASEAERIIEGGSK